MPLPVQPSQATLVQDRRALLAGMDIWRGHEARPQQRYAVGAVVSLHQAPLSKAESFARRSWTTAAFSFIYV